MQSPRRSLWLHGGAKHVREGRKMMRPLRRPRTWRWPLHQWWSSATTPPSSRRAPFEPSARPVGNRKSSSLFPSVHRQRATQRGTVDYLVSIRILILVRRTATQPWPCGPAPYLPSVQQFSPIFSRSAAHQYLRQPHMANHRRHPLLRERGERVGSLLFGPNFPEPAPPRKAVTAIAVPLHSEVIVGMSTKGVTRLHWVHSLPHIRSDACSRWRRVLPCDQGLHEPRWRWGWAEATGTRWFPSFRARATARSRLEFGYSAT